MKELSEYEKFRRMYEEKLPFESRYDYGSRIRKSRIEAGYSIAYIAKVLGVSVGSISCWERGFWKPRKKRVMEKLHALAAEAEGGGY